MSTSAAFAAPASTAPASTASAATPTPTTSSDFATQVKTIVASTEAKLKEKVELQSIVGYVGKISTISSGNLTLDSQGNLIQVTTSTKTVFQKDTTTIKSSSLAIGDKVIVIGTSAKEGIVSAKRITVIKDEPNLVTTSVIVSKISLIDLKKKTITLNINGLDHPLTLSKKSTVKLEELQVDQTILGIIKEYEGKLSISRAKVL
jgi:hypothetical protein